MQQIIVPSYYKKFKCIADKCKHSCCKGWEIDIDEESLGRYENISDIAKYIEYQDAPHFRLKDDNCPFLRSDNLCQMILDYGEGSLCQICADHPRFRNFWTDRIEVGLGLACEEAARIILFERTPMRLEVLEPGDDIQIPDDELYLMDFRQKLFDQVSGNGPDARLLEYLIYRHIADALYDDRLEERIKFIQDSYDLVLDQWDQTDGSDESLIEAARAFSVKYEYVVED